MERRRAARAVRGSTTGVAALGDLWALRPGGTAGANTWTHAPDPDAAARHLPAIARHGQATIVFGGRDVDRKPLGDTWLVPDPGEGGFSGGATHAVRAPRARRPAATIRGALVDDPGRDRLLLFGGIGDAALDDLWVLSFD